MTMLAVLLVCGIAGADLVGWVLTRITRGRATASVVAVVIVVWAILVALLSLSMSGLGVPLWGAPALVVLIALWPVLTGLWAAVAIGYVGLIALLVALNGAVPVDFAFFAGTMFTDPRGTRILALIGVATFLGLSANLLCRGALKRARVAEEPSLVTASGHTQQGEPGLVARAQDVLRTRWTTEKLRPGEMRGGRLIGPLERWIIVALALTGAQAVVAALMAAKGIVRFPEISKDRGDGSKAEEFLVGSLISWGLAGAGAALIFFT